MLPHSPISFALIILFLSTFPIDNVAATNKLPKGFSVDLIHRDSPLSPFYNSSMTHWERVQNAALSSLARANRFNQSMAETDITPSYPEFLMKIFVGTPPVERWAEVDTGSDLIWFQCAPCTPCNPQNAPFFDPKGSSTYMALPCNSKFCKIVLHTCGTSHKCMYYYSYLDESYTMGELATESISFGTCDGGRAVSFPNTVFGCGHSNNATVNGADTGLVGLGRGNLSLISQLGHHIARKFSYCLPPYSVKATTKLKFGEEADISSANGVVSTTMITDANDPTSYYLNLEGITVGQQRVQIDQDNRNTIIDSGTTLTLLQSSIYEQVKTLVKKAIGADQWIVQNPPFNLCYTNVNSIKNVPNFEVHFTGASISLKPQNLFLLVSDHVLCLAMSPTNGKFSIYGNVAQIDFDVEYDLDQRKVSFAPVDCAKQ